MLLKLENERQSLRAVWSRQKNAADALLAAARRAPGACRWRTPQQLEQLVRDSRPPARHRKSPGRAPLVRVDVDPDVVAQVVSDWTGIPVGRMVRDQAETVMNMESPGGARARPGPRHAPVAEILKTAQAGLRDPQQPIGVFLLVGPSGVGKTEPALAVADLLFGGESTVIVNMSEFQEKHTVSRLIGSPPGYVGYGEGGVLTEAVRQRPYSVVLLDEVEKAHLDVLNLFYQVFDKGPWPTAKARKSISRTPSSS